MNFNSVIFVGAVNWEHAAWHGVFYPDDLPDDWLLSYYNTQFQAVYLPAAAWQDVPESTWTQWLNDTQDGFCFVLESAGAVAIKPASERVMLATPAWAVDHVWWLDEARDLRALAQRITRQAAMGEPLFVFSRSADIGLMQQANNLLQVMGY
ncbi:MAG: hypothetical protein ACYCZA_13905 [Thiobacillus sp.]